MGITWDLFVNQEGLSFSKAIQRIEIVSKIMAPFILFSLLIITAFEGYIAPHVSHTSTSSSTTSTVPPAPTTSIGVPTRKPTTISNGGTTGAGDTTGTGDDPPSTIGGATGTGADPLDMCYVQTKGLEAFHTYYNETFQKDTLNVDHCYESLHTCNQWVDQCRAGQAPTNGGNTPHHRAVDRALEVRHSLEDISEYDFELQECQHELSVLWMKSRMCYHQVAIERTEFYPCHQQVMACIDYYEECVDALSATTNSAPPTHPPASTGAPTHPPAPITTDDGSVDCTDCCEVSGQGYNCRNCPGWSFSCQSLFCVKYGICDSCGCNPPPAPTTQPPAPATTENPACSDCTGCYFASHHGMHGCHAYDGVMMVDPEQCIRNGGLDCSAAPTQPPAPASTDDGSVDCQDCCTGTGFSVSCRNCPGYSGGQCNSWGCMNNGA